MRRHPNTIAPPRTHTTSICFPERSLDEDDAARLAADDGALVGSGDAGEAESALVGCAVEGCMVSATDGLDIVGKIDGLKLAGETDGLGRRSDGRT